MIIPKEYNDTKDIAEILLSGKTVVLNMEAMNFDTAQRVIDFMLYNGRQSAEDFQKDHHCNTKQCRAFW